MDSYRKQLLYRATHRGMRETDTLLGEFASEWLKFCTIADLSAFDSILAEADKDLLDWILERVEVPNHVNQELIAQIIAFNQKHR